MRRLAVILLLSLLLIPIAHERAGRSNASSGIVATFDVVDETYRTHIENPDTIEQVLALQRGESTASIPVGRLRAGEEYNTGWSWHTDPWEIEMADFATEVCDGLPSHVEDDQDYWINTVGTYCPWSAELVDVVFLAASCGGQNATIVGTAGNDTLTGTAGPDVIQALAGHDTVYGLGGNDVICGGPGSDTLGGGPGNDTIFGNQGADSLNGAGGKDNLNGGAGNDALNGGAGVDLCNGGAGANTLSACP